MARILDAIIFLMMASTLTAMCIMLTILTWESIAKKRRQKRADKAWSDSFKPRGYIDGWD